MYDALTPLFDDVTRADLLRNFKSEKLGIKKQGRITRERVPRKGVRIFRDKFNVPHIYGRTNDDVTWGAGWAVAHDRELLLEQARYNARVAVIDAPGLSAIGLVVGLKTFKPSSQTERELAKEVGKLKKYGKRGRQLLHDMAVYVKGVNAFYKSVKRLNNPIKPWTVRDVIAFNAIKSQLFGQGGGGEVDAAQMLDGLQDSLGADKGLSVWNDLRLLQDPETPVSIKKSFPYGPASSDRSGNVVLDNGSFQRVPMPGVAASKAAQGEFREHASNVLMVAGKRSKSGHPLFVGGPQIGYFYPGPDTRDGPARPGLERTRRNVRAVPRLHPDRAPRGLRLDAHLGGRGHRGHLRGDALRRKRHQVPLPRPVPRHEALQRRDAQR